MNISRFLRIPIPLALIAAGGFLFFFEIGHPAIPLWADLVYTMGFMFLLNGMGAAIDCLAVLAEISRRAED